MAKLDYAYHNLVLYKVNTVVFRVINVTKVTETYCCSRIDDIDIEFIWLKLSVLCHDVYIISYTNLPQYSYSLSKVCNVMISKEKLDMRMS